MRRILFRSAALATAALFGCAVFACGFASAQTLQVTPNPAMADQPVAIRVSGLQPGERVTIEATLVDGNDAQWTSEAQFVADQQGAIDTSTQAPASGSYKGISGPGLIWSMKPVDKRVMIYRPPKLLGVQPIVFELLRNGRRADSATLEEMRLAEGVREIRVQGNLHGILFVPAGEGPHPGATFPEIKAVVAYVPANVRYPSCCGETHFSYAWTWRGQPLPFVRAFERNDVQTLTDAEIPVEATHGPILMIGAGEDGVWQSGRMVDEATGRLKRQHFPFEVEVLKYPHAGHRAATPELFPTWHGPTIHPVSGEKTDFGGSVQGDAESTLDAISKVLEFLQENLQADSTTSAPPAAASTK